MAEYDAERISSITYFGRTPEVFGTFDKARCKEVYRWYKTAVKHKKVKDQNKLTKEQFDDLIAKAKNDYDVAQNLCMKIQGLKIMHFFIENEKNLSDIMNKMINGAKKISVDNGFFIKIY